MKTPSGVMAGLFLLTLMTCGVVDTALPRALNPDQVVVVNGKRYVEGEFYLDAAADTAALKPMGVRHFQFLGRSVHSVRYSALVPVEADFSALPAHVTCQTDLAEKRFPTYEEYLRMLPNQRAYFGQMVTDPSNYYHSGFGYYYNMPRSPSAGISWDPSWAVDRANSRDCGPNTYTSGAYGYPGGYGYRGGYGHRDSGYGHGGGGRIGFDYPPTDRPSRRNTYTYNEPCPVFGIPSTGTFLLSPGNPARPVIGTPRLCR